jgi:transcriptional regulator with XRE-family HTH domain
MWYASVRVMAKKTGPELLVAYEKTRNLTHKQVAEKVKTSAATISRLITGDRSPGRELSLRLQQVLKIPLDAWPQSERSSRAA